MLNIYKATNRSILLRAVDPDLPEQWLKTTYDCLVISDMSDSYIYHGVDQECTRVVCHYSVAEKMVADGLLERIL